MSGSEPGYRSNVGEHRREQRYRPDSLQLAVRPPGLFGGLRRRSLGLVDCSRSGCAWLDPDPPQVGDWVICELTSGRQRLACVPARVRSVDRLVSDFRVGVEFALERVASRHLQRLALALARLDVNTAAG